MGWSRGLAGGGRAARRAALVLAIALAPGGAPAARAAPAALTLMADDPLRFGAFAVMGSGYRVVSAAGAVYGAGLLPVARYPVAPAQFTISYTRAGDSQRPLTIDILVSLAPVPPLRVNRVTATLSRFETDLPGVPVLLPGVPALVRIAGCTSRVCTVVFRVGGRIDLQADTGGAELVVPLPLTATLLSAR